MHYRTPLALAALLLTSSAFAWEVTCKVDDFTDEETCQINTQSDDHLLLITRMLDSLDAEDLMLYVGAADINALNLYEEELLIRIDRNEPWYLHKLGGARASSRSVEAFVFLDDADELINQMIEGEEIRVRLSIRGGSNHDMKFSADGFSEAWNELLDNQDF